jgi:hypothetical protein
MASSLRIGEKQGVWVIRELPYSQASIRGFARPGQEIPSPAQSAKIKTSRPPIGGRTA